MNVFWLIFWATTIVIIGYFFEKAYRDSCYLCPECEKFTGTKYDNCVHCGLTQEQAVWVREARQRLMSTEILLKEPMEVEKIREE